MLGLSATLSLAMLANGDARLSTLIALAIRKGFRSMTQPIHDSRWEL